MEVGRIWTAFKARWSTFRTRDSCDGRLVSTLEGGYDLHALAASAAVHVAALMAP